MQPGLSIVIPSHGRPDLLRACLTSVEKNRPADAEVLVVDDASPGAAVSTAAGAFRTVRILRLPRRGGFCVAANAGIAQTTAPIVHLLNDDTEVCAGWAECACARFADGHVAAVAPLVLYWPNDGESRVDSAGDGYHSSGIAAKHGHGERLREEHLTPRSVFGASASSAFYRRDALQRVGLFPEEFGSYFEDVDLAFRLHRAGYSVCYEPRSRVLHHVSATHGTSPSTELLEQQSRNEELVFWRNLPARSLLRVLPLHLAVLIGKAWRRCREGRLLPFLRGRLQALGQLIPLLAYRRSLRRIGPDADLQTWEIE